MIDVSISPGFDVIVATLRTRAADLVRARRAARALARRAPDRVWRTARLLWPSFSKG